MILIVIARRQQGEQPLKCLQQLQALTMELCRAGGYHSARLFGVAVPSSGLTCLSGLSILSNEPTGFIIYVDVYICGWGEFLGIWGLKVREKEFGGILLSP